MNAHFAFALVIAAAASAAAVNARADDITIDPNPFVSTRSRAEVKEELRQFQASGQNPWADDYNPLMEARGTRTRAEVMDEYQADRAEVAALTGEDSGSSYLARVAHITRRNSELAQNAE